LWFWVELRGPYYNTNAQVRDLERLLAHLPEPTSGTAATPAPRKRSPSVKQLNQQETAQLIPSYQAGAKLRELGAPGDCSPTSPVM
jgi:hypothetical protein